MSFSKDPSTVAGLCFVEVFPEFLFRLPSLSTVLPAVLWGRRRRAMGTVQRALETQLLGEKPSAPTGALQRLKPLQILPRSVVLTVTAAAERGLPSKGRKAKSAASNKCPVTTAGPLNCRINNPSLFRYLISFCMITGV